ncbi:oxidoreductase [Streptomyces sp. NPDC054784]
MAEWTERDIPDLSGRVAVVTGANSGLGLVTATELARHGARVVLAVRRIEAGEEAADGIRRATPGAKVEARHLDLGSLRSVRDFAKEVDGDFRAVDVLVNNAGVLHLGPRRETDDGFEAHFGVNVLGHFALTGLLLDALGRAEAGRVVGLSSTSHRGARLDLDDLMGRRGFKPRQAYGRSKLACTVQGLELHRRLERAGWPVRSVLAHPGICRTNLSTRAFEDKDPVSQAIDRATQRVFPSVRGGARPQLHAATAPGVRGGLLYGPSGFREFRGPVAATEPAPAATDPETGRRLWEAAEELTGVRHP